MSIEEIKSTITQLSDPEAAESSLWLVNYHHERWEQRIEGDLDAGRLDALFAEADREHKTGLAKPL